MQTNATLADVIWPTSVGQSEWVRRTVLVICGALLLTLSAKLKIPLGAIPITMQTFVVLALGMAYGRQMAAATLILYLAAGAGGLPVFAGTPEKGIGIAYMFGPTGGYLLGFALAAIVCGWLAEHGWDRTMLRTAGAMLIGNAVIYLPGLLWLGFIVGWDKPILAWGLTPFLLGDLLKLVLAMLVMPACWRLVRDRWNSGGQ